MTVDSESAPTDHLLEISLKPESAADAAESPTHTPIELPTGTPTPFQDKTDTKQSSKGPAISQYVTPSHA